MNQTETESIGQAKLPLIRLSLAKPVVEEAERRGVVVHDLLGDLALSRDAIFSPELFVPAPVMYSLLEALAQAADDPYLLAGIGESLDLSTWPVFAEAVSGAGSVGDFFHLFTMAARKHATSIRYELKTDGADATFKAQRGFTPNMVPAQADAFYAGMICNIFRRAVGLDWDPQQVTITVCDLGSVPANYQGMRLQQGGKSGPSIRFPMGWLLQPFRREPASQEAQGSFLAPPSALISAMRESLKPYLHLRKLSVAKAAEICGFNERVLRRKLHAVGTSLSREIASLREQAAVRLLLETEKSIADIANAVGFGDPASFARSFRRWTGVSPQQYRRKHRSESGRRNLPHRRPMP